MPDYILVESDAEYKAAGILFETYARELGIDLGFQNFEAELKSLKEMYGAPNGGIILCEDQEKFIACVGIRKIDEKVAELKRMFVLPEYQQQGIGKNLLSEAELLAKKLEYHFIRLDTLNYMKPAMDLYKRNGYYEIEAYYFNPNETAVYFEKKL